MSNSFNGTFSPYRLNLSPSLSEDHFNQNLLTPKRYQQMFLMLAPTPIKSVVSNTLDVCKKDSSLAINHILRLSVEELLLLACDANGSKQLQEQISTNDELRTQVFEMITDRNAFLALAKDSFGNFLIQRMMNDMSFFTDSLIGTIEQHSFELSFNRHGYRIVQKYVNFAPVELVQKLLNVNFAGHEAEMVQDINAHHIIQSVVEKHMPLIYAPFIKACIASLTVKSAIENKYGCRVFQFCLERLVDYSFNCELPNCDKVHAHELLHLILMPILCDAWILIENEYANYIIQYILRSKFLVHQRTFIIRNYILHKILWLSQGKFASHVVEQAFVHADPVTLECMFKEVLDGYVCDAQGRHALDIMLFDQFANYVVQRMLEIAIEVYQGKREGNRYWLSKIVYHVKNAEKNLLRFSSGKKILRTVKMNNL